MEFLDELNAQTGGKFDYIRVESCVANAKEATLAINLLIPADRYSMITDDERQEIVSAVKSIIPKSLEITINYIKSFPDISIVKKHLYDYVEAKCPTVGNNNFEFAIVEKPEFIDVCAKLKTIFFNYCTMMNLGEKIEEHMSHCICKPIKFSLVEEVGEVNFEVEINDKPTSETYIMRRVITSAHEILIGKTIVGQSRYIVDRKELEDNAIYCGKIIDFQRREAKSGNPYYIITIDDTTGRLIAKGFTRTVKVSHYDSLKAGDEVIIQGKIVLDTFAKDSVLIIANLAKCMIDYGSIITKSESKSESKYYSTIKPVAYKRLSQESFLTVADKPSDCFIGRDFVVFDIETTGFDKANDKITEIGAIKMRDGEIIEEFSTLINPEVAIPSKITEITGIDENMVRGKPTIENVIGDFYKFTRGAVVVGHNVDFDMGFIMRDGFKCNYQFDNPQLDTLRLARQCITSANYKLGTLCKVLGIDLTGAHRAMNDVLATHKLLLEIGKRMPV